MHLAHSIFEIPLVNDHWRDPIFSEEYWTAYFFGSSDTPNHNIRWQKAVSKAPYGHADMEWHSAVQHIVGRDWMHEFRPGFVAWMKHAQLKCGFMGVPETAEEWTHYGACYYGILVRPGDETDIMLKLSSHQLKLTYEYEYQRTLSYL